MKRNLTLAVFTIFCFSSLCFAASQRSIYSVARPPASSQVIKNDLSNIEKTIFGIDYSDLPVQERLRQAELLVYGQVNPSNASESTRVAKLVKDLNLKIPKQDTNFKFVAAKSAQKSKPAQNLQVPTNQQINQNDNENFDEEPQVNTPEERYPVVDKMEMQVFKQTYSNESIYSRLKRLEMSTYKTSYESDSLSNRVDRLKGSLLKVKDGNDYNSDDDDLSQMPSLQKLTPDQTLKAISNLEKFGLKTTYPNDSTPDRLARLENHFLNQTYPDDDTQTRIERIGAIAVAEPGAREYDNLQTMNKIQDTATYIKLGSILLMILGMFF